MFRVRRNQRMYSEEAFALAVKGVKDRWRDYRLVTVSRATVYPFADWILLDDNSLRDPRVVFECEAVLANPDSFILNTTGPTEFIETPIEALEWLLPGVVEWVECDGR